MRVAGIDGCKDGWVAVVVDDSNFGSAAVCHDADLVTLVTGNKIARAVVDIPIGLSEGPANRPVEQELRRQLPSRTSSVFNSPSRQATLQPDYRTASSVNQEAVGVGLSQQTWAIIPKIIEAEKAVNCIGQGRLIEGHPEMSFCAFWGQPARAGKKTAKGMFERLGALAALQLDIGELSEQLDPRARVAADDLIDAAILCWSAHRLSVSQHQTIPQQPKTDPTGLVMSISA